MNMQYTNELTPALLAEMDKSPFSPEQLANMNEEARAVIEEQVTYTHQHPVNAIWRIATEGSLTRRGGRVAPSERDNKIQLDNG